MTITNRIKSELFNANIDYQYSLDAYRAEFPNGTNFCYEKVSSKAATMYATLKGYESAFSALEMLVNPKYENSTMEELTRKIIDKYNNAQTTEEWEGARDEYFDLYTVRA